MLMWLMVVVAADCRVVVASVHPEIVAAVAVVPTAVVAVLEFDTCSISETFLASFGQDFDDAIAIIQIVCCT